MTTQIVFRIDKKLKQAAQKKARQKGISLSDLYHQTTRSFVEDKVDIGLITEARRRWEEADTAAAIADHLKAKKEGKLKVLRSLKDLR